MSSLVVVLLILLMLCVLGVLVVVVARLDARISRLEWDRFGSLAKHANRLRGQNWETK